MKKFCLVIFLLCIISCINAQDYSDTDSAVDNIKARNEENNYSDVKNYRKRLETVDGVEIASSYVEYLDLAFGDLDDRLKKSYAKLTDFKERINKRSSLFQEITNEIDKRNIFSLDLSKRDKLLRTRLIRNTEMKSALQNLADIAGYKLNTGDQRKSDNDYSESTKDYLKNILIVNNSTDSLLSSPKQNISHILANSLNAEQNSNNNSYTRYIEMAYTEVSDILTNDKQTLIEVIRKLKTNTFKLRELEQLKVKVKGSLERLNESESRLNILITHDSEIANILVNLEQKIKKNQFDEVIKANDNLSDDI